MYTQVLLYLSQSNAPKISVDETNSSKQANISNVQRLQDNTSVGYKGFQLSPDAVQTVGTLDGSYKLFGDDLYPGYVSSDISDAEGNFNNAVSIVFEFSGVAPRYIYIAFDRAEGGYPKAAALKLQNNSKSVFIQANTPKDGSFIAIPLSDFGIVGSVDTYVFTLTIYKWSLPYKSAKVTQLTTTPTLVFTGAEIVEFDCSENSWGSNMALSPGICEQYADIIVYDRFNLLHDLADRGLLVEGYNVAVRAIDNELNSSTMLGKYITYTYDINSNDSRVKILCGDASNKFAEQTISALGIANRTLHMLLSYVFSQAGSLPWRYFDAETRDLCESIYTKNNFMLADSVQKNLQKICNLGMLRIYWHIDTFIVMRCYK